MDLVLDVAYHGPVGGGAPFCCHLQCTAAYADDVSLIDKWKAKWRDLAWRTVNAASLVTLVTSVDCSEALAAHAAIQQILDGTASQEQRNALVSALEDRERHLFDISKDGAESPDPALARAALALLPAVRTALGMLTHLPKFLTDIEASVLVAVSQANSAAVGNDERHARTMAGFQKLLQIGTEVATKTGRSQGS